MTRYAIPAALASVLLLQAGPAAAQNTSDPATATPPATGTERPATSTPSTPPVTSEPSTGTAPATPRAETPSSPSVVAVPVPVPQQAPPAAIELQDQPYPNGFADPADPFGNGMSLSYREEEDGFDWGLLGLLGLLGLIPLFRRGNGYTRVVYRDAEDDPARVIRRDRVEVEPSDTVVRRDRTDV